MIQKHLTIFSAVASVLALGAGVSHADTVVETGFFTDLFGVAEITQDDTNSSSASFEEGPVTGVAKFDASLGTLTGVSITAEFDTELSILLDVALVTDEAFSHSAGFNATLPQVFIGYSPTGSASTFVLPSHTFFTNLFAAGDPFTLGSDDSFDSTSVNETSDIFASSGFVLADFVGAGDVDTLRAIIAMPIGGNFVLDNVDEVFVLVEADMLYTDLTVEYTFTPIPEPASVLYLIALASAGVTMRRRRIA